MSVEALAQRQALEHQTGDAGRSQDGQCLPQPGELLKAALLLLIARLLVLYVPMRHWRHRLASAEPANSPARPPFMAWKVARIVSRVAAHVPFQAVCLPQAMAAQWMLRRRGTPSHMSFGARRERNEAAAKDLEFHAWLNVGGKCILGGQELATYSALPPFDEANIDANPPGAVS